MEPNILNSKLSGTYHLKLFVLKTRKNLLVKNNQRREGEHGNGLLIPWNINNPLGSPM